MGKDGRCTDSVRRLASSKLNTATDREHAAVGPKLILAHKSSRDMFDCPLVRLQDGNILLFAPAVIDVNIPLVVLSNLSNRGEGLNPSELRHLDF